MNKITAIKKIFNNSRSWVVAHKIISSVLAVMIVWGGYYEYKNIFGTSSATKYILSAVQKGTLVVSVSGSGQVSASSQLEIKPKVSGDVSSISVTQGQTVKAGQIILQLDPADAQKSVRDAEVSLRSAQLALSKLQQSADELSLTQAQNALDQAKQSKQNAQADLVQVYDSGFNTVSNAFIDLPGIISGINNILNGASINSSQNNADAYYGMIKNYNSTGDQFRDAALSAYQTARLAYDKNIQDYKNASRYDSQASIDDLINQTYNTTKSISEAIKTTKTFLDLVNDTLTGVAQSKAPAILTTHIASLQSYTVTTNTHLSNLINITNSIKSDKDAIINGEANITEKTQALAKLKAGTDPLDIQSQELSIKQKQNALLDARQTLSDYYIRPPFDGVVAKINVSVGDPAGPGATVATITSPQQIAQVALNEVDVSKVRVGQKATLTFDAFSDLTITGKVVQVDTIGTTSQGVVTYNVKIAFDTQDDRVKGAMSTNAAIIVDTQQDVLMIPNSAVKSNGSYYVETFDRSIGVSTSSQGFASAVAPARQNVSIGSANDSMTVITGGLKEGDLVVTRTISSSTTAGSQSNSGGFRLPGMGGR